MAKTEYFQKPVIDMQIKTYFHSHMHIHIINSELVPCKNFVECLVVETYIEVSVYIYYETCKAEDNRQYGKLENPWPMA